MDKKELRQDPIRERIISFLSKIESNKNVIFGIFVLAIVSITFATYYSSIMKGKNKTSSINLGKGINTKIDGDKEASNLIFSELLKNGTSSSKSVSLVNLIDYYLFLDADLVDSLLNLENIKVSDTLDSLLNLDIKISDNVLSSKVFILQGNMSFNNGEYESALDFYNRALDLDAYIYNEVKLKLAQTYYKMGDLRKAESIVDRLLEKDDIGSLKNRCKKIKSMLKNQME